jgi:elongation factor 3
VHRLAATTFVQTVDAGTLSLTVPLLTRGLKDRKTALKRKCAVIIENMAKLVEDPVAAAPFLPELMPLLARSMNEVADEECRGVCRRAHELLQRIQDKCNAAGDVDAANQRLADAVSAFVSKLLKEKKEGEVDQAKVATVAAHAATLVVSMTLSKAFTKEECATAIAPALMSILGDKDQAEEIATSIFDNNAKLASSEGLNGGALDETDAEEGEDLCDCKFSLAYGSRILLNQARLHLKRGKRYGIIATKSAGKTTLLKSIANYQIDGFPPASQLKTVFLDTDVQGFKKSQSVVNFVHSCVESEGVSLEECKDMLLKVEFTEEMIQMPVTSLSGGWRMKLALARGMLRKADILLMDEPTNHLDTANVRWVEDYLTGEQCENITSLIVSHDTPFLDKTATHIIHFSDLKLNTYIGNMSSFIERFPDMASYNDITKTKMKFTFPKPAPLDGVRSKGKPLMVMQNCSFTYPNTTRQILKNVSVKVSMGSRIACVGANGAGKSTMIKLLTGENAPCTGSVIKNPNLTFAYIAQHAFHHIEQHLSKTPNEYIRWRFQGGEDKEARQKSTTKISDKERKIMEKPFIVDVENEETGKKTKEKRVVEKFMARRKEGKKLMYEVKWKKLGQDANMWYDRDMLVERGFVKLLDELDRRLNAAANAYQRTLSAKNVETHLGNVGLEKELASHNRISSLSGGQKVMVVLAACTWNQPQIIILDEPTNYLDRDALGALANAINEFEGGVCLITHNKMFADLTTRETWVVANGTCDVAGDADWEKYAQEQIEMQAAEDRLDAFGNTVKTKKDPNSLKKREKKKLSKEIKKKINSGAEMSEWEEECANAWGLWE